MVPILYSANEEFLCIVVLLPGAIHMDSASRLQLEGWANFTRNVAQTGFGGGIYLSSIPFGFFTGVSFTANSASWGGAVATVSSGSFGTPVNYIGDVFDRNQASEDGGGIYSIACFDDVQDVVMMHNFAGKRKCVRGEEYNIHACPAIYKRFNRYPHPLLSIKQLRMSCGYYAATMILSVFEAA